MAAALRHSQTGDSPLVSLPSAPTRALPCLRPSTGRDLRLDLFRGLALWLIFLDHIPTNIVSWFTIRNYGFSDATEIFIFISGYTAAFVYGRAMRERGFVVAGARILKRAWQIYVAHIFLFAIFMAEIAYVTHELRQSALRRGDERLRFPAAAGRHADPGAAAEVQAGQHGRAAALHRAAARVPVVLWLLLRWPTSRWRCRSRSMR